MINPLAIPLHLQTQALHLLMMLGVQFCCQFSCIEKPFNTAQTVLSESMQMRKYIFAKHSSYPLKQQRILSRFLRRLRSDLTRYFR